LSTRSPTPSARSRELQELKATSEVAVTRRIAAPTARIAVVPNPARYARRSLKAVIPSPFGTATARLEQNCRE